MNMYKMTLKQLCREEKWELSYESVAVSKSAQIYNHLVLDDFTQKELRLMISQNIGNEFLVPLALEALENNLFLKAEHRPGDLLEAVCSVESNFWEGNEKLYKELMSMIKKSETILKNAVSALSGPEDLNIDNT